MTRVTVLQWMMMPFSKREYWEDRVLQGWVHEFGFAWILFSALHLLCYVVLIEMCGKKLSSIDAVQPGRERDVVMIFFYVIMGILLYQIQTGQGVVIMWILKSYWWTCILTTLKFIGLSGTLRDFGFFFFLNSHLTLKNHTLVMWNIVFYWVLLIFLLLTYVILQYHKLTFFIIYNNLVR